MRTLGHILWGGRRWIEIAVFFFVIGLLLGLTAASTQPDELLGMLQPLLQQFGGIGQQITSAPSPLARGWIIFQRNAQVTLLMMVGGLLLGSAPVIWMLANGFVIGIVLGLGSRINPAISSPFQMFIAVAPHGVLELPALWIGAAWAMKLGLAWLTPDASGHRLAVLRHTLRETAVVLALVLALLLVAGMIEGNVTLALVRASRSA